MSLQGHAGHSSVVETHNLLVADKRMLWWLLGLSERVVMTWMGLIACNFGIMVLGEYEPSKGLKMIIDLRASTSDISILGSRKPALDCTMHTLGLTRHIQREVRGTSIHSIVSYWRLIALVHACTEVTLRCALLVIPRPFHVNCRPANVIFYPQLIKVP